MVVAGRAGWRQNQAESYEMTCDDATFRLATTYGPTFRQVVHDILET